VLIQVTLKQVGIVLGESVKLYTNPLQKTTFEHTVLTDINCVRICSF